MRYVMRQKLLSWGDDFLIQDEDGRDVFLVDGKAFSLGNQLSPRYPAGSGTFTKKKTGEVDTFSLRVEGEGEMYLRGELNRKGKIRILMVPDSDDVAATYFGAGNSSPSNRH